MNERVLNALGLLRKEAGTKDKLLGSVIERAHKYPAGKLAASLAEGGLSATEDVANKIYQRKLARTMARRRAKQMNSYINQATEALKAPGGSTVPGSFIPAMPKIVWTQADLFRRILRGGEGMGVPPSKYLRSVKNAQSLGYTDPTWSFTIGGGSAPSKFDWNLLDRLQQARRVGPYKDNLPK